MNTKKAPKTPFALRAIQWGFPKVERIAPSLAGKWATKLFFKPFRFDYPESEVPILKAATKLNFEFNNLFVRGYSWGEGPTVLLLHGWAGRATQFREIIPALVESGHRVIAIDLPAHGKSEGSQTNILEISEMLLSLQHQLPSIQTIVTHSFGGVVALYSIQQGLMTQNVVTIATPAIAIDIITEFCARLNASPAIGAYLLKYIESRFDKRFEEMSTVKVVQEMDTFTMLIVHDADDKEVGVEHAEALHKVALDSELFVTNDLGHSRILRDPAVIERIIKFISNESKLRIKPDYYIPNLNEGVSDTPYKLAI